MGSGRRRQSATHCPNRLTMGGARLSCRGALGHDAPIALGTNRTCLSDAAAYWTRPETVWLAPAKAAGQVVEVFIRPPRWVFETPTMALRPARPNVSFAVHPS